MANQTCPECGAELPPELGQHALAPTSGLVQCPSCGAQVTLEHDGSAGAAGADGGGGRPEDEADNVGPDYFAGEDTMEGVMDEIEQKEEQ